MDNFMDKLVEKINAQGQIRPQGIPGVADANKDKDEAIKELSVKFQQNNEKVVELASQYKESIEESIHKENVRCYRNTQAMVEENIGKLPAQINESMSGNFEKQSDKIVNDIEAVIENRSEATKNSLLKQIKSAKGFAVAAFVFSFLDFIALVVIMLWIFRII